MVTWPLSQRARAGSVLASFMTTTALVLTTVGVSPATAAPSGGSPLGDAPAPLPASSAAPSVPAVPDAVAEHTELSVTLEDGSPAEGATVHRGDTLIVHGSGFDPSANREGFLLPIPPTVPKGVWVAYAAFPEHWRPSEGAPSKNRETPHSEMAWVMPEVTLETVPEWPITMRRTLARTYVPMNADGTFTARITVSATAADAAKAHEQVGRWGIYSYAAGGAVNAAEEHFLPVSFSPDPGPNTPAPESRDLVLPGLGDYLARWTSRTRGGVSASDRATWVDHEPTFEALPASEQPAATPLSRVVRFRGQLMVTSKFNITEVVLKDPELTVTPAGAILTALVSTSDQAGPDSLSRKALAQVSVTTSQLERSGGHVTGVSATMLPVTGPLATLLPAAGRSLGPVSIAVPQP